MGNTQLESVIEKLRSKKNFYAEPGITEPEIDTIERSLGIKLPAEYKSFLSIAANMMWFGHIILGKCDGEIDFDTVLHTKYARERKLPSNFESFPQNAIVIEKLDSGGYFILHGTSHEYEGQVRLVDDHDEGTPTETWPSFTAYLNSLV